MKMNSLIVKKEKVVNPVHNRVSRQRSQPIKLSGFCDIVKEAASKKDKSTGPSVAASKPITKTLTKTTTTTTTTITNGKTKSLDKWEEFRERKLAKMKQHKINVERRMQGSCNIDSQMYWSQRADKLKRYPKHEALHPSWYTENIYSNQSIDLETDDYFCNTDKYDNPRYSYGPNDYSKKLHNRHLDNGYNYPKSRSCCFGSGYDERPKPNLMPKSNSFAGASGRCMNNMQTMYSNMLEEESFIEVRRHTNAKNGINRSGLRKFYCWENEREKEREREREREREQNINKTELFATAAPHFDDDFCLKNSEIYQIERDRNYYNKQNFGANDAHGTSNANYIRNYLHNRNRNSASSAYKMDVNEINGNLSEDYNPMAYDDKRSYEIDSHLPFEEEYLIIHQNKPNTNAHATRNSFSGDHGYHGIYSTDVDPYKCNDLRYTNRIKNNLDASTSLEYTTNDNCFESHHSIKSKSMLEVKPPNRYDDSSSDSTIDDLYDFNFDFINQYDLDYRNNNSNKNAMLKDNLNVCNANYKEKNINLDTYVKYRKINMDVNDDMDDVSDEDLNEIDMINECPTDEDDIEIELNDINFASPQHSRSRYRDSISSTNNDYIWPDRNASERFYDNCSTSLEYYSAMNNHHSDAINRSGNAMNKNYQQKNLTNNKSKLINKNVLDDNTTTFNRSNESTNGAISLINNIFSIYKPKKYSPLSGRTVPQKTTCGVSKSMNVPSTVRPLGAPYNDFLTSMKRPLTIAPSCFTTQKRTWSIPSSASVDQAQFKIIPEKTGLKISPLYRFGYEDDSKLRLKCTARPLLFPM